MITRIAAVAATAGLLTLANPAHAHIKLLKPTSAIQENAQGGPQKDSPCGPGMTEGQGMSSNQVTTFMEGEEITVEWTETVPHNGHFRIALAKDPSEFKDPKVTGSCQSAEIQDPPVLPILADGLFKSTSDDGKRDFSQKVKLPAGFTCDKCTLQLIQFMTPHPLPCFYYHCANIKVVASGAAAGSGAAGATGGAAAVSGQGGGPAAAGAGGSVIAMTGGGGAGGSAISTGASGAVSTAPKPAGATSTAVPSAGTTASAGRAAASAAGSSATPTTATTMNGVTAAPTASAPKSGSGGCTTTRAHAGDGALAGFMLLGLSFAMRRRRVRSA